MKVKEAVATPKRNKFELSYDLKKQIVKHYSEERNRRANLFRNIRYRY